MRCIECGKPVDTQSSNCCRACLEQVLTDLLESTDAEFKEPKMTVKELFKQLQAEKFDKKGVDVVIKLPDGATYDASMISIYDDMAVIEVVPRETE